VAQRKAENGKRRPVHVGSRLSIGEVTRAVVSIPLFRGEYVERIALDVLNVTKTAETNVDQPPIFGTFGVVFPFAFQTFQFTTAIADDSLQRSVTANNGDYLGGEANPGGNYTSGLGDQGRLRMVFKRNVIGDPMPVGQDALNNADARFIDRFRTVIKRGFEVATDSVLLIGVHTWRLDAQTDFGVAEIDNSLLAQDWARAYFDPVDTDGARPQADKARELIYEGDNFIEADSFKETDRRSFMIVRPTIHRMRSVANWS